MSGKGSRVVKGAGKLAEVPEKRRIALPVPIEDESSSRNVVALSSSSSVGSSISSASSDVEVSSADDDLGTMKKQKHKGLANPWSGEATGLLAAIVALTESTKTIMEQQDSMEHQCAGQLRSTTAILSTYTRINPQQSVTDWLREVALLLDAWGWEDTTLKKQIPTYLESEDWNSEASVTQDVAIRMGTIRLLIDRIIMVNCRLGLRRIGLVHLLQNWISCRVLIMTYGQSCIGYVSCALSAYLSMIVKVSMVARNVL